MAAAALRPRPPIDPATQVLPVNGSREALFAIAQAVIDTTQAGIRSSSARIRSIRSTKARRCSPARRPVYLNNVARAQLRVRLERSLPKMLWERVQLVYVCSPGNPTGHVMTLDEWKQLFELSDRYGFVIASDECYSEIYFDEANPPLGALRGRAASSAATAIRGSSCSRACRSAPTCRACARASSPATPRSSSSSCSTAPTTAAR